MRVFEYVGRGGLLARARVCVWRGVDYEQSDRGGMGHEIVRITTYITALTVFDAVDVRVKPVDGLHAVPEVTVAHVSVDGGLRLGDRSGEEEGVRGPLQVLWKMLLVRRKKKWLGSRTFVVLYMCTYSCEYLYKHILYEIYTIYTYILFTFMYYLYTSKYIYAVQERPHFQL